MAAGGKRSILIEVLGEFGKFVAGSRQASKATGSLTDKVEAAGAAIALAYSAKKVIDFARATVTAAVEDAKAQDLLAQALRRNANATDQQIASVEDWIHTQQNSLGIMDDELRPALSTLARVTKDAAAAQDLLTLAMDVSRGTGKDLETVSSAIAKAYGGNTTALGRLVPGLKTAGSATLSFADAKARLNEMFGGAAATYADTDAGKLERLAAQYEDMKETIGTSLLPVMHVLVGVVSSIFDAFNRLSPAQQQFLITAGLIAGAVYVGVSAFIALRTAVAALGLQMQATMPWLAAIGAVLTIGTVLLGDYGESTTEAEEANTQLRLSIIDTAAGLDVQSLAFLSASDAASVYRSALFDGWTKEVHDRIAGDEDMVAAMERFGITMDDVLLGTRNYGEAVSFLSFARSRASERQNQATEAELAGLERLRSMVSEYASTSEDLIATNTTLALQGDVTAAKYLKASGVLAGLSRETQVQIEALLDKAAADERAASAMDSAADGQRGFFSAADDVTVALTEQASAMADTAQRAADLKSAIDAVFQPYLSMEEATRQWYEGLDKLNAALEANGATLDVTTTEGRANRDAIEDQVKAVLSYAEALVAQGATSEEAAATVQLQTAALREQLETAGLTTEQINSYLETLGLTPENVDTTIRLAEAERTKRQLEDMLDQLGDIDDGAKAEIQAQIDAGQLASAEAQIRTLAADRDVTLHVGLSGSGQISISPKPGGGAWSMKAYASGGYPPAGEAVLVGEHGPEIAQFPSGTRIRSSRSSERALAAPASSSPTVHVHVAGSVITERQLAAAVADGIRTANRRQNRDTLAPRIIPS